MTVGHNFHHVFPVTVLCITGTETDVRFRLSRDDGLIFDPTIETLANGTYEHWQT